MRTLVIHHSADYDGIFCREIARKFLPDAEFIGWDFKDAPLAIPDHERIYVLDLPVDRVCGFDFRKPETLNGEIAVMLTSLVWIDHHKTSIDSHPKDIPGYRIDGVAACRLAWQWFKRMGDVKGVLAFPEKTHFLERIVAEPRAVRLAGEYDVWDHRGDGDLEFQFGLRSRELTDADWMELLSEKAEPEHLVLETLLRDGKLLQTYQQRNDAGNMHRSYVAKFESLTFLCLNTVRCNSLTFATRDVKENGHDALMGFYYDGSAWNYSLYHAAHRTDLDLSVIAKKYNGGGHRGACGFRSFSPPHMLLQP